MHISRRLLHTTLYIEPPKLILTGRFVLKIYIYILALWTKPESTMYTLDRLTWDDMVKVSVILPDGQTATLVCHRSRPQPPITNSQCKCSTYSCSQVKTWMAYTRLLCQAGISGGSHVIFTCSHTHFHIQAVKYCIFLMLLLDECGTVWEQN